MTMALRADEDFHNVLQLILSQRSLLELPALQGWFLITP